MLPTLLLLALCSALHPNGPAQDAPPGLVLVRGGPTRVGSRVDEIEKLALEREELAFALAGETPQHTVEVADFFLMPTEVTNEQYAEFVRSSGAKPPRSWGAAAIQAGQERLLEEQARAKQEARAAGKPFEPALFDPEAWWNEHWAEVEWAIPEAELAQPVVFVDHSDAERYARWAGLRLMTEQEFQRAGRGDSARTYPWGEQWDDKRFCRSLHSGKDLAAPVGSHPEGAVGGIHDLAGNVWEWTSSPYTPFPGYQALRFTERRRVVEAFAPFDPALRVTVGGSFQMDRVGVRLSTRRYTDPAQSTNALGFRCAASLQPGLDAARAILAQDLSAERAAELEPSLATTLRRWSTVPGQASVPGYAVVSAYEHVLACPVRELPVAAPSDLAELTRMGQPVTIGLIDVPRPLLLPELDAGVYLVSWRARGELVEAEDASANDGAADGGLAQLAGFTTAQDCFVLSTPDGVPQVALPAPPLGFERLHGSSVAVEPATDASEGRDSLRFTLVVQCARSRSKGLVFELPLALAAGTLDASWK